METGTIHIDKEDPIPSTEDPPTSQADVLTWQETNKLADKRGRFGRGAGMGCGKWKNWVTLQLGAEFTLGAHTVPSQHRGSPR